MFTIGMIVFKNKKMIAKELLCPFSENALSTYQYLFTNPSDRKKKYELVIKTD